MSLVPVTQSDLELLERNGTLEKVESLIKRRGGENGAHGINGANGSHEADATAEPIAPRSLEVAGSEVAADSTVPPVPKRHKSGRRLNVRLSARDCDRLEAIGEELHRRGLVGVLDAPSISQLIGLALKAATDRPVDWQRLMREDSTPPKAKAKTSKVAK